jgi:hypothetical protein
MIMVLNKGKNTMLFQRYNGAIRYLEGERKFMQNVLSMALISLLAALNSVFVVML